MPDPQQPNEPANQGGAAGAGPAGNEGRAGANGGDGAGTAGAADAETSGRASVGTTPAFYYENNDRSEKFNLRPRPSFTGPIPEDQRKISQDVYEARNVLKLLKDDKAISDTLFREFIQRVTQAGEVGCVAEHVHPRLAGEALEQIRADIVRRAGRPLVYRYLGVLALLALVGSALGLVIVHVGSNYWPNVPMLKGYGYVLIGAMAGAWFSVAAGRWQISFDSIPDYPDIYLEPVIRMLFVAFVAAVFALFLHLSIITIKLGNLDFASFTSSISVALLIGFVAGMGQRALSVQLTERARKFLGPG